MRSGLPLSCLLPIFLLPAAAAQAGPDRQAVVAHYADIAAATYGDALTAARSLRAEIGALVSDPSPDRMEAARAAWIAARAPYQQSEAFRFGNAIVDDWEGRVNAWPLDEGLIDYVADGQDGLNVIASPVLTLSGVEVDAREITPDLIAGTLHQAGGIEANVASGYHAIEFLLWGQDLNGTGPGAGARPWTDYAKGPACTGGHCERRADYLVAATDLLLHDLEEMAAAWEPGGAARDAVLAEDGAGLMAMLTGMGSLSYGELAGERMKLGLMLNDPEEEQDCFSDTTPNSHLNDAIGIRTVYLGQYRRLDGQVLAGPSLSDLVAATDPALDADLRAALERSVAALSAIRDRAAAGMAYDQMLAPGNAEGAGLIMAGVEALVDQTATLERVVQALDLGPVRFEGSDSLDTPAAVFQ